MCRLDRETIARDPLLGGTALHPMKELRPRSFLRDRKGFYAAHAFGSPKAFSVIFRNEQHSAASSPASSVEHLLAIPAEPPLC